MISSTFFFLFSQLSVGMLWTLLVISPRVVGGSFFKFSSQTAAILMGVTLGFDYLFPSPVRDDPLPFVLLAVTAVLAGVYNRMVHIEQYAWATALLVAAGLTGLGSITLDSVAFTRLTELGGWEHWILAANHLAATALLGAVMLTMVFGHWYLVVPRLSIDPLRMLTKIYLGAIGLRVLTLMWTLAVLESQEAAVSWTGIAGELLIRQGLFFWPRILFGIVVPVILGVMIWSTVKIRHTQAATGLLYLAVVTLLFGEFFSKFLLWSLRVPL